MTSVTHYIATRFNVAHRELRDWPVRGLDVDWLEHRLPYFEKVCAPSVGGQTLKDFTWVVFVHPHTPPAFMKRTRAAVDAAGGHIRLSESGSVNEFRELIGHPTSDLLITTRLDNDDALAGRHVERVQDAAVGAQPPFFLNHPFGAQLHRGGWVVRHEHRSSPFLSYVEVSTDEPQTVWDFGTHVYLGDAPQILQVEGSGPGWLQSIHGRNMANPAHLGRHMSRAEVEDNFDIDAAMLPQHSIDDLARRRAYMESLRGWRLRSGGW